MNRTVIRETRIGTRTVAGTEWPVRDQLVRDCRPGQRPTWIVVRALCNGVPDSATEYGTLDAAEQAFAELSAAAGIAAEDARDIVAGAIDDSFNYDRTVHLTWTRALEDELRARVDCDDEADGNALEFWGSSERGHWRIHLEREVRS